jgi:hypothetical protein
MESSMSSLRCLTAFLLASLGLGLGCQLFTDNEIRRERQPANLRFYGDPLILTMPETVAVATPFDVTVRTYGGGCIDEGDTEVSLTPRAAEVRPYDIFVTYLPPSYACTDDLRLYSHRAVLRFEEIGPATVTVRGRAQPGDSVIAVQRSVQVQ